MAGPDPDETALTFKLPTPRFTSLKDLRVAMWAEQPGQATDGETVAKLHELAAALEREGATVSRHCPARIRSNRGLHPYLRLLDAAWSGRISDDVVRTKRQRRPACQPATWTPMRSWCEWST